MAEQYITLDEWAQLHYGENAPHPNTLRRWAANGHIYPRPRKHGRPYLVKPSAVYVNPHDPDSLADALGEADGITATFA